MKNLTQPANGETTPDFELCAADLATVIRMARLTKMVGISRSMIYLKIDAKSRYFDSKFPKPVRLGQHAIGWLLSDIYEYIRSLKKE
jgi:predicted DNA-binding transcriptional regulator AlpA